MDYRERLRSLRIQNKLTQADVSKICNVALKTVSHWETCRVEVPITVLAKLCEYYKVSSNYVLGLPEYPPPSKVGECD